MSAQSYAQSTGTTDAAPTSAAPATTPETAAEQKAEKKAAQKAANTEAAGKVEEKAAESGDTHGGTVTPTVTDAAAETVPAPAGPKAVTNVVDWFAKGQFAGDFRTIYFSTHNNFFSRTSQDTISYGGGLEYTTASLYGFSLGFSGYIQRGIDHNDNPAKVDSYLGPNLTAMGEAYVRWEGDGMTFTAGNQAIDVPFASTYDWRMAPQLFQGFTFKYGDADNYVEALKIFRFKSYIDDSFSEHTMYNVKEDPYSTIGDDTTDGFWGFGGQHKWKISPLLVTGQAWYFTYQDYADLAYFEGQVLDDAASWKPFIGAQYAHETGDGRELLGNVNSQVYGLQLGVKHNSLTATLGWDYIAPHSNSYLNGSLVTPYAHNVASGPLFAQPFLSSTQDLGSGNAYAIDVNGAPMAHWFVGARYSYMDLKSAPDTASIDQSEYLVYAIYNFDGKLKGLSIADFFAIQTQPGKPTFLQNRLQLEYAFGH
ncbi:outer membrane porin, OprD family [Pararobbsia silviterrae]|uniref:Outer membrane porin, OprD family n=2 Tax=Pararobbsia silviterrae TaxID=1792498 RepID=A0A494Y5C4_9BURK|nr:outer membrane porin, OprD family [Pararobbsia silviterrae]